MNCLKVVFIQFSNMQCLVMSLIVFFIQRIGERGHYDGIFLTVFREQDWLVVSLFGEVVIYSR